MISEDYISFETAKLLKDNGFRVVTNRYYNAQYDQTRTVSDTFAMDWNDEEYMRSITMPGAVAIPTLQMAMKWLRKIHGLHIDVFVGIDESYDADGVMIDGVMVNKWNFWTYRITTINGEIVYDAYDQFDVVEHQTYEKACEEAIKYCLENLI